MPYLNGVHRFNNLSAVEKGTKIKARPGAAVAVCTSRVDWTLRAHSCEVVVVFE